MRYLLGDKTLDTCMIGTWAWGTGGNGGKMIFGKSYDREQLYRTFETAVQKGLTFWDTAEVYGMGTAEKLLGLFIKDRDVTLSTKHFPKRNYTSGENRRALEGSLQRLGRSSVDLYWLHAPRNIAENMRELAQLQREGLIGCIGLSNGSAAQIRQAQQVLQENGSTLTAIQNHYSLLAMAREADVLTYCQENGLLFFGYMILEQGALSGHYDAEHPFPRLSMRGLSFGKEKFRRIRPLIDYIRQLAQQYGIDSAQIATIWAVAKGVIPIVGLTKPSHAVSLPMALTQTLSPQELSELERLAQASGVACQGTWE